MCWPKRESWLEFRKYLCQNENTIKMHMTAYTICKNYIYIYYASKWIAAKHSKRINNSFHIKEKPKIRKLNTQINKQEKI